MNVIFETQFGSHVYGTDTPNSDHDYKGLFIPRIDEIVLGTVKESIVTHTRKDNRSGVRNSSSDVDTEYKELRRFIKDAISGQTYALDMLFTPRKFWLKESDVWNELHFYNKRFLSKSMNAFLGYIRQQTGKYGMKGTRMASVLSVVEALQKFKPHETLGDIWDQIPTSDFVSLSEYTSTVNGGERKEVMLTVLEKKFQKNVKVKFVLENLDKFYQEYGVRAKLAMENEGVDWKAVSHAYRACYQLIDIAQEGEIIFPLKQAEYVKKVKTGQVSYKEIVQEELPELMGQAMSLIEHSDLPDVVEPTFWADFILKHYVRS